MLYTSAAGYSVCSLISIKNFLPLFLLLFYILFLISFFFLIPSLPRPPLLPLSICTSPIHIINMYILWHTSLSPSSALHCPLPHWHNPFFLRCESLLHTIVCLLICSFLSLCRHLFLACFPLSQFCISRFYAFSSLALLLLYLSSHLSKHLVSIDICSLFVLLLCLWLLPLVLARVLCSFSAIFSIFGCELGGSVVGVCRGKLRGIMLCIVSTHTLVWVRRVGEFAGV